MPLYSWFRNLSRHLFLFAFGVSVLAGFGVAAIEQRSVSLRAGAVACWSTPGPDDRAGAILIRGVSGVVPAREDRVASPGPGLLAIFSVGVWIQFAILLAVVAVVIMDDREIGAGEGCSRAVGDSRRCC